MPIISRRTGDHLGINNEGGAGSYLLATLSKEVVINLKKALQSSHDDGDTAGSTNGVKKRTRMRKKNTTKSLSDKEKRSAAIIARYPVRWHAYLKYILQLDEDDWDEQECILHNDAITGEVYATVVGCLKEKNLLRGPNPGEGKSIRLENVQLERDIYIAILEVVISTVTHIPVTRPMQCLVKLRALRYMIDIYGTTPTMFIIRKEELCLCQYRRGVVNKTKAVAPEKSANAEAQ